MKKVIIFDTETTGFIPRKDRIVQFGAICGSYDQSTGEFYEERTINQYINPTIDIPQVTIDIHGITTDFSRKFQTMDFYIREFISHISKADIIVGHNLAFDMRMLHGEMSLRELSNDFSDKLNVCTMKAYAEQFGVKNPKLAELHISLFGKGFDQGHNALNDTIATKDCFLKMVKDGIISI